MLLISFREAELIMVLVILNQLCWLAQLVYCIGMCYLMVSKFFYGHWRFYFRSRWNNQDKCKLVWPNNHEHFFFFLRLGYLLGNNNLCGRHFNAYEKRKMLAALLLGKESHFLFPGGLTFGIDSLMPFLLHRKFKCVLCNNGIVLHYLLFFFFYMHGFPNQFTHLLTNWGFKLMTTKFLRYL